ncbi:hypothetical protein Zm00014a_008533 [Zea mays]|uniref:DUF547 domain-containing protein n=1 Tax=Zea mays TaxID=4577 RepID=A0A3L6E841_MAIZE|nr:hypothetical protein Zm00014a_008533 [Zea mays]
MLCVRAEDALAAAAAAAAASDKMRSVTLGGTIQRAVRRMAGGAGRRRPHALADSGTADSSASASASCSGDDISSTGSAKREAVNKLQRQLQEEIDLHMALTDAITYNAALILKASMKLPDKMQEACSMENEGKEDQKIDALTFSQPNFKKSDMSGNLWNNPNQLSEEMVRSMKDIFLHLSASPKISREEPFANSSSSAERLSGSTLTTLSDSSIIASVLRSPSIDWNNGDGIIDDVRNFDPYNVKGKEARRDVGSYCSVAEVSWMYIGNEQLEYASGALKKFRFLVEQLSKVDPSCMNCDEQIAFWVNLYNALIMHAYLAYGVPENDIKLFALMQKVRIFSAENVRAELQESMRDYIRASVGINDKGELVVPKLLQSYAKGIVEDSLLADWICRHLTLDQVAAIQDTSSSSSHKQRLLGVRSFSVIPFDSRFRYLFLSNNTRCQN